MSPDENPHTEQYLWGSVRYWQDGTACGREDAWTEAVLSGFLHYPEFRFPRTSEVELRRHITMLEAVFEAGKRARSREIAALIGVGSGIF